MTIKDELKPKADDVQIPFTQDYDEDKKKPVVNDDTKGRVDKLEQCVRDKDKRIGILEKRFINIKLLVCSTLLVIISIAVILSLYLAVTQYQYFFSEALKFIGVISTSYFITYGLFRILIVIGYMSSNDEEVYQKDKEISIVLSALITTVISIIYLLGLLTIS